MVLHRTLLNPFPEASSPQVPQRPCSLHTTQRCSWSGCSWWFFCGQCCFACFTSDVVLRDQVRVSVMCTPRERRPAPSGAGGSWSPGVQAYSTNHWRMMGLLPNWSPEIASMHERCYPPGERGSGGEQRESCLRWRGWAGRKTVRGRMLGGWRWCDAPPISQSN